MAKPYVAFVHPGRPREPDCWEPESVASGALTLRFENRYRAKDGSYKWLSWLATPVAEEAGLRGSAGRHRTQGG